MTSDPEPGAGKPVDPRATGDEVRALMRRATTASLATALAPQAAIVGDAGDSGTAWPFVSLVLSCLDHSGCPLLLLSDLAEHTQNLKADSRAALLFDGTTGRCDPLTGPRATLLGRIERCADAAETVALLERFVARHPGAAIYRGFADFGLYRLRPERAHLVAGFGKIVWVEAEALVLVPDGDGALAAAEAGIVAHMNDDHADAVALIAAHFLGWPAPQDPDGAVARLVGIDPEGADLRVAGRLGRVEFAKPVGDAAACRVELVRLTKEARRAALAGG